MFDKQLNETNVCLKFKKKKISDRIEIWMSMKIFYAFEINCLYTFYVAENNMWDPEPEVWKEKGIVFVNKIKEPDRVTSILIKVSRPQNFPQKLIKARGASGIWTGP